MSAGNDFVERLTVSQFYEPFSFGPVWQHYCFRIQGTRREYKIGKFRCWLYQQSKGRWIACESLTGGMVGHGTTRNAALRQARTNIQKTPDFAQQVRALGPADKHREIPSAEALRRLSQSTR